jgi:integral membrane protein (TIGR01906 family)
MVDVKNVVQGAFWVLWIAIGVLVAVWLIAWRGGWLDQYRAALARGGWLMVILAVSIILFVLLAFGVIFVWFHQVFFEAGTWSFFYSDSLIRLFPERFWRDTFLIVAGLPALVGAAMGYFLGRRPKRTA